MIKNILFILAVVLLAGAGYFGYQKWNSNQNLDTWSFVPSSSLMVYETNDLAELLGHLNNQPTWKALRQIDAIDGIHQQVLSIDSILNQENAFVASLNQSNILFSLHQTGNESFDFLINASIPQIENRNVLSKIQEAYLEAGFRKKSRTFLGNEVIEIIKDGQSVFTYFIYRQYFVGSKTSFLVEDAIRTLDETSKMNFKSQNQELYQLVQLQQDQGNLYLNFSDLPKGIRSFTTSFQMSPLAKSGFLDVSFSDQNIRLDGFTFAEEDEWLTVLKDVEGQSFEMTEVIPTDAAVLHHYTFSDGQKWGVQYSKYLQKQYPDISIIKKSLLTDLDLDVNYVYQLLSTELAISQSFRGDQSKKLLLLKTNDQELANQYFNGVVDRYQTKMQDSVLIENYKAYTITALPTNQLPYALTGGAAGVFESCFFTSYRDYLIISNDLPYLKQTLDNIEEENTWRKSLRKSNFLDKINRGASYSYYIHLPGALRLLGRELSGPWGKLIRDNEYLLRSFENAAIQFSFIDDKYYTNVLINQPRSNTSRETKAALQKSLTFADPITSKAYLVDDHTSAEPSIFVQDSSNTLYWVSQDFKISWSKPLSSQVYGGFQTLDFYRNDKLQYAFLTHDQIHILDREGKYLPGFPKKISRADSLRFLSIVDYDGSKNYRFAISDRQGQVFLTNKEGKTLDGWKPKRFERELAIPPQHHRIANKDLFLIALKKGDFHILNRRGRYYQGFPFSVNDFIAGEVFFGPGSTFNGSIFYTLTENGNLNSFDLTGSSQDIVQLYRPNIKTTFDLISDVAGNSFIITRKAEGRIEFLNSNTELLFEKDYLQGEELFIQYYNLNPSHQYIIVGNRNGQFIYIYDLSGRLITNRPLIGNQPVGLMYYEKKDELNLYIVEKNELKEYRLEQ